MTTLKEKLKYVKTNHILHLLLTIFTAGFWGIMWISIAITNESKRAKIRRNHKKAVASL